MFNYKNTLFITNRYLNSEDCYLSLINNFFYLESLKLPGNYLMDISFLKDFTLLKNIHLNDNYIVDISPLFFIKNLRVLNLNGNRRVENINPLRELVSLEKIDLSYTSIYDLSPLMELKNLKTLRLNKCYIRIKDFYYLLDSINLKELCVRSSKILPEQLKELQKAFPNCKILY